MSALADTTILVATDSDAVFEEVDAALAASSTRVLRVRAGHDVVPAIHQVAPDLVVLDLQIGNMGGVATSLEIRNEESGGRLAHQRVLLLIDRVADEFVAAQGGADAWIVKPLDALRLRRTATEVLHGPSTESELAATGTADDGDPAAVDESELAAAGTEGD